MQQRQAASAAILLATGQEEQRQAVIRVAAKRPIISGKAGDRIQSGKGQGSWRHGGKQAVVPVRDKAANGKAATGRQYDERWQSLLIAVSTGKIRRCTVLHRVPPAA